MQSAQAPADEGIIMRIKIADVRKSLGVSQGDLADAVGLSRPYLAQIENGARNLSAARQKAIAEALNVDPTELIDFAAPELDEERLLLEGFRSMTKEQRTAWLDMARVVLGKTTPRE